MEFFWTVIEQAFAPAAVVAAVVFLLQKYFTRTLDRDLERYKKELEADLALSKAYIENELQARLFEHQTKFSLYHQHKAEFIRELYAKILDYQDEAIRETAGVYEDETIFTERKDEFRQKLEKLSETHNDLERFFAKNSIYLDEQLRSQVERGISTLHSVVLPFYWATNGVDEIFATIDPGWSKDGRSDRLSKAESDILTTTWAIREKLEKEFRKTLSG